MESLIPDELKKENIIESVIKIAQGGCLYCVGTLMMEDKAGRD